MRVNPISLLMLPIVVSLFLPHSAQAARIWNNMPFAIVVCSEYEHIGPDGKCFNGDDIEVDPHSESYSFDRKLWTDLKVLAPFPASLGGGWTASEGRAENKVCGLGFGLHAQLQGGNYMVVSPPNQCVVCDSNHNPLAGGGQC